MSGPARNRSDHRRTFVVAMAASIALHGVALALVRLGIPVPEDGRARGPAPPATVDAFPAERPLELVRLAAPASRENRAAAPAAAVVTPDGGVPSPAARPALPADGPVLDLAPVRPTARARIVLASTASSRRLAEFDAATSFRPASAAARGAVDGGRAGRGLRGAGKGCPGPNGGGIIDRVIPPGRIPPRR